MYAISYVYNRLLHYAFLVPLRLLVSLIHILFVSGFASVNSISSTLSFGKLYLTVKCSEKTSPRGKIALGATLLVFHELLQIYITYIYNIIIVLFSFYFFLVKKVMSQFFCYPLHLLR